MWKPILAGTAALVIAGTSLVYAQNRPGREGNWRPNVEDMRAFGEARLAGLKAGLVLKPDQEKTWPAFEQAAREFTRVRIERLTSGNNNAAAATRLVDPVEWMQRRASALSETGAALKKLGDATGPLYNSLDESQKRRFAVLNRIGVPDARARRDGPRGWQRGMHRTDANALEDALPAQRLMSPVRGEERL